MKEAWNQLAYTSTQGKLLGLTVYSILSRKWLLKDQTAVATASLNTHLSNVYWELRTVMFKQVFSRYSLLLDEHLNLQRS